jgi:hypothetical protein
VAVAVVLGAFMVVRVLQGTPPSTDWAELSGPRESSQALAGPGDRIHIARSGDTFWSLAEALDPGDPRPVVDALVAANGGSSAIAIGQRLVIPAELLD